MQLGLLAIDVNTGKGLVIPATIRLEPGSGEVLAKPVDKVDNSTIYSIKVAFITSSLLDGQDPRTLNVIVEFKVNTSVSGPSASGFIASSILGLLRGVALDTKNNTMTGMVSLTGLVLPVAGILEKSRAAAQAGYKQILMPQSEYEALSNTTKVRIAEAISVVPVCSIIDAVYKLSNITYRNVVRQDILALRTEVIPSEALRVFRTDAEKFITYTISLLSYVDDLEVKKAASMAIDYAREALQKEDYYAAASLAFVGLLRVAEHLEKKGLFARVEEELNTTLSEAIQRATIQIEEELRSLSEEDICYYWRYAALAEAAYRLHLAKRVLENTKSSEQAGKALALLRALSAGTWARVAHYMRGPLVYCRHLYNMTLFLADYARLSYDYITSILEYENIPVSIDNSTLLSWLDDMNKAIKDGDYVLGMGLALFIISYVESLLASTSSAECIIQHYNYVRSLGGLVSAFPGDLYFEYALSYGDELANITDVNNKELFILDLGTDALVRAFSALAIGAIEDSYSNITTSTYLGGKRSINSTAMVYTIILAEAVIVALLVTATIRSGFRHEVEKT
jgi:predicted S18 family serine protease